MSSFVREINSLTQEIKRLTTRLSLLKKQKNEKQMDLFNFMESHNIDEIDGIQKNKIQPKIKIKRKKKSEKRNDAVRLFMEIGINDPETFYDDFLKTQKYQINREEYEE